MILFNTTHFLCQPWPKNVISLLLLLLERNWSKRISKNDELAGTNSCQINFFNVNENTTKISVKFLWKIKIVTFYLSRSIPKHVINMYIFLATSVPKCRFSLQYLFLPTKTMYYMFCTYNLCAYILQNTRCIKPSSIFLQKMKL